MTTTPDGEVVSFETVREHEGLTDHEAGLLLSAVGNHEIKAGTLLAMAPGVSYDHFGLRDLYEEKHGDEEIQWDLSPNNFMEYAVKSFEPAGLVTIEPDGTVRKTGFGETYGEAVAGWALTTSARFPGSIMGLLGAKTANGGNDVSPIDTRYRIFRELTLHGNVTFDSLSQFADPTSVSSHVNALAQSGFVDQLVNGRSTNIIELHFNPGQMQAQRFREGSRREAVRHVLSFMGSSPEMPRLYGALSTNPLFAELSSDELKKAVQEALSGIRKKVPIDTRHIAPRKRSLAMLRDEKAETAAEIVEGFESIRRGDNDAIEEFREIGRSYVNHPSIFTGFVGVAKRASPEANKLSADEKDAMLLQILSGGPMDGKALIAGFAARGYDYSKDTINLCLRRLRAAGLVQAEWQEDGKNAYSLAEETDEA